MNRITSITLMFLVAMGFWNEAARAATSGDGGRAGRTPMIVIPRLTIPSEAGKNLGRLPWSKASQLTGFLEASGESLATYPTWLELAYDRKALWVRFRCEGQSVSGLKAEVTDRDGFVWRDDSVEVAICPSDAQKPLYHFIVNSTGVTYDAEGLDKSWDATWTAQATTDKNGWSVTMVIPFDVFKPMSPPRPSHSWRMNFFRNCRSGDKRKRSSWSPTIGSLQDSRYYGRVEFGSANTPPVRFIRVDPVRIGDNLLRVEAPAVRYGLTAIDGVGSASPLREDQLPADGAIPFRLDDDEIRRVELSLFSPNGGRLARAVYPMASPPISATVMELDAQFNEISDLLDRLPEAARRKAQAVVSDVRPLLQDAVAAVSDPDQRTPETWDRLAPIVSQTKLTLDGPAGYARTLAMFPHADFAVGLANPMQQIMIQGYAFEGWFDGHYHLKLARNEHEGFQVVVMPFHEDLQDVSVSVSPLAGIAGGEALRGKTKVSLVGHVDVDDNTRYKVEHHGWWPDPLLDFQRSCDVRAGDHVAFWIDVATQADTKPGDYRGQITVAAKGCRSIEIDLNVRVWDFRLPDGTHLPNAFTYNEGPVGHFYPDRWGKEMRHKYYDLILDHRLNIDHLYRKNPPDIDVLEYARGKGQNAFNIGAAFRHDKQGREQEELNRYLSELKKKGLFPYAYVYGFDEVKPEKFAEIREVFGQVHRRYPGLETMTTAIDRSYGKETGLRDAVDIWVPLTDWYDLDEARKLRAEGKRVWWYICVVPEHPYANWFIEYPAIEARLLMGAMSFKYEVDGFLYYMINLWTGNHRPIASGPYTEWDPGSLVNERKDYTANGDGSLICPGPDGPLATIRLENIRDGLEDYEYLYLLAELAEKIRKLPADPNRQAYLERVAELLDVPPSVVRNLIEYTRETKALYGFREQLAKAILEGGRLLGRNRQAP